MRGDDRSTLPRRELVEMHADHVVLRAEAHEPYLIVAWSPGPRASRAGRSTPTRSHATGEEAARRARSCASATFYGPGTYYESELPEPPRIHIDRAPRCAYEAMEAKGVTIAID
jgi:hypothetical protein